MPDTATHWDGCHYVHPACVRPPGVCWSCEQQPATVPVWDTEHLTPTALVCVECSDYVPLPMLRRSS